MIEPLDRSHRRLHRSLSLGGNYPSKGAPHVTWMKTLRIGVTAGRTFANGPVLLLN